MTNIINGIDVSECEKLGETIDGFTCGLGKRIRFANEIITKHNLCKNNPDCYFKQLKRLLEENKKMKNIIKIHDSTKYDYYKLMKENEGLKKKIKDLDAMTGIFFVRLANKYEQALEEIRKEANRLLFVENPIYGYNNSNYFEILAKYVLAKTEEALNDRD